MKKTYLRIGVLILFMALLALGPGLQNANAKKKVLILGIDGMDPNLLTNFTRKGVMPNFSKLIQEGDFRPLGTTIPPQSPVAWATFSTGVNPGSHGIFDFIHRKPDSDIAPGEPYLSTSKTVAGKTWSIGNWVIPISGGGVELLRHGTPFWAYLTEKGIPVTMFKVPSNYPPDEHATRSISGMGTPDMTGGYGSFSFYTDYPPFDADDITGGEIFQVDVVDNKVEAELYGPRNDLKKDRPKLTVPFTVYVDPEHDVAKVVVQDNEFMLKVGEWSEWKRVEFEILPVFASISGICRFYLKALRPDFEMYVTPINVDPSNSVLPISKPASYAKELYNAVGFYYTQGMPEDTKALSEGILTDGQYIEQAKLVLEERIRLFDYELSQFKEGLLFFYFSSLDQNSHMFWRTMDQKHPLYDPSASPNHTSFIRDLYIEMDKVLGNTLSRLDDETTLIIVSDHGFASFRRCFQLNTWLKDNGYVKLINEFRQGDYEFFANVDWSQTRAYNLGINGLYVNLEGRERRGIVPPSEKEELMNELIEKLEKVKDPETGQRVIARVYKSSEVFDGEYLEIAPDLIVGFNKGYRASWETILGEFPLQLINDNEDKWSGDHCMATELVPGVVLSNKKILVDKPALYDIGPTVLAEFDVQKPQQMIGRVLLDTQAVPKRIEANANAVAIE